MSDSKIFEEIKERVKFNKQNCNLENVIFFLTKKITSTGKDCDVKLIPLLMSEDSTTVKDLRTNKVYDISQNTDSKKGLGFWASSNYYDDNVCSWTRLNHLTVSGYQRGKITKHIEECAYTYTSFYEEYYKKPYILNPKCLDVYDFFMKYHIHLTENLISTKKEIIKFCNSFEKIEQRILKEECNHEESDQESIRAKRF